MGKKELWRQWIREDGGENLTDQQLLEALLEVGHVQDPSELAKKLIAHYCTVWNVLTSKISELVTVQGLAERTAIFLSAVGNLYTREESRRERTVAVTCPERAARLLIPRFRGLTAEAVFAIYLDSFLVPASIELINTGQSTSAQLDIFPMLCKAAESGCADIIVAHNHPTADPAPSGNDLAATETLRKNLAPIGARLLDHIIVARETYVSLAAEGKLDTLDESGNYKITAAREVSPWSPTPVTGRE